MISRGITKEGKTEATDKNTAAAWGSGTLPVLATPAMILLIEKTASDCVQHLLQDGESTVGTLLEIKHSSPSVIGSEIFCKVELINVDRSRLVFDVIVRDSAGEVGSGRHERFIVNNDKFMKKAISRAETK
jgi:predicted thioesterase